MSQAPNRAEVVGRLHPAVLLAPILLLALLLRLWGIAPDLPYLFHPDEPSYVALSQSIFQTGDLNPHFFRLPSLLFYVNAAAYLPYYLAGHLSGLFASRADLTPPISLAMGVTWTALPSAVLWGRGVTALFGTATVGLVYLLSRRLIGRPAVGLLAALFTAVSPTNVAHSRFVTPDALAVFLVVAVAVAALNLYRYGRTRDYLLVGVLIGLSAAAKYNAGLIGLTLPAAHFLRHGRAGGRDVRFYAAVGVSGLAFLAATPFAVLDFPRFLADLQFERQHYATGHPGMEGDTLRWYLVHIWSSIGPIGVCAVLALANGRRLRSAAWGIVALFPVVYFLFINQFVVRNDRTLLPIMPFLFVAAAAFCSDVFRRAGRGREAQRWAGLGAAGGLLALTLLWPASQTVFQTQQLFATAATRHAVRGQLEAALPAGARVALEPYAPYLDPSRYSVQGFWRLIDHDPDWYAAQGFDYLVASAGLYGRFFREPARYPAEVAQYTALFNHHEPALQLGAGAEEVRVYRVRPTAESAP